jgi:hypothetical protein
MSEDKIAWKPAAMVRVESEGEAPIGFQNLVFVGIGMKSEMMEPINPNNWKNTISGLKSWGDIPSEDALVEEIIHSERGIILKLKDNHDHWSAEFFPWGTDGRLRARISLATEKSDFPIGGFSWNEIDLITVRKWESPSRNVKSKLTKAINSNDLETSKDIVFKSAAAIGSFHKSAESGRVTPRDSRKWNKRVEKLEALLRANTIWRAPHTKDTVCIITIGDIRFSDMIDNSEDEYGIYFNRPRLSDSISRPNCEFPAMRDFSSLLHDLNRIFYSCNSKLSIIDLRESMIEGWRSTAPEKWSSKSSFYTPRGGVFFWEYEQCLLDVIEAVSHQSGKPEPAVSMLVEVPGIQRTMFNHRIVAALSFMTGFFCGNGFYQYFTGNSDDFLVPIFLLPISVGLYYTYRRLAPSPALSILRVWNEK